MANSLVGNKNKKVIKKQCFDDFNIYFKALQICEQVWSMLCPGVGDRGVVLVSAGHVPVVVESWEGDGELSISLSVQADVHGEGGTFLRLGLEPAFHIQVHMMGQGDGADNRFIKIYGEEVISENRHQLFSLLWHSALSSWLGCAWWWEGP